MKLKPALFRAYNAVMPKHAHQLLLASHPLASGNARGMFEYLKTAAPEYQTSFLANSPEEVALAAELGLDAVQDKSLAGAREIASARVILTTHNEVANLKSRGQAYISMWHGTPLKAINRADTREPAARLREADEGLRRIDAMISTSPLTSSLLSAAFHLDMRRVVVTGYPRNDLLFTADARQLLGRVLHRVIDAKKVVMFLPTFRQGYNAVTEGKSLGNNLMRMDNFNLAQFDNFLRTHSILFVAKLHPFEEACFTGNPELGDLSNFCFLSNQELLKQFVDLYQVLGAADTLITDYSSVYFDYLLLDRPILFTPVDQEQYQSTRGFMLEPYEAWTPGPKVFTQRDLENELSKCLTGEQDASYSAERRRMNAIFNTYQDDRSAERVWQLVRKML